jgi:hypothetical protein
MPLLKNKLILLFIIYVLMDWITTYQICEKMELIEVNPIVRYIIKEFGWVGFMVAKLLVFGLLCGLSSIFTTMKVEDKGKVYSFNWAWTSLYIFILISSIIVVVNNVILILVSFL